MRPIDADALIEFCAERWIPLNIDAVNMQPSIQPVATDTDVGDKISRQEAIDAAKDWYEGLICGSINGLIKRLNALPTVQPERKRGEWLPDNNNAYEMRFVCSCCKESEVVPTIGFTKYRPLWDFCPNCGADMRGEQDG